MGKLIPGKHFGSRINEKSIKNWEKAKTHIIDLGEVDITPPPKRSYIISQYLEKSN